VVVWNGDILADVDIRALREAHRASGAIATLAVAERPAGEGTIGLGRAGDVVRVRRRSFGDEASGGDFVGVQVIGDALRSRLPIPGCMVEDGWLPALAAGARIAAFPAPAGWDDIGTLGAYLAANARWLERAGLALHAGAGASIAPGVDATGSVIGEGARVGGSGALRGCVVWPGATATAPLDGAVVTTAGRVARAGPRPR
jgi:mannose-1-phosphate guanylyltransferase